MVFAINLLHGFISTAFKWVEPKASIYSLTSTTDSNNRVSFFQVLFELGARFQNKSIPWFKTISLHHFGQH